MLVRNRASNTVLELILLTILASFLSTAYAKKTDKPLVVQASCVMLDRYNITMANADLSTI